MSIFLKRLNLQFFSQEGAGGGQVEPKVNQDPQGQTGDPAQVEPKSNQESMIPKSRFDEVNTKMKAMEQQIAEFTRLQAEAQKAEEVKALEAKKEQGKYQELYEKATQDLESFKPYETRAKELETLINGMVEQKLTAVPEEMKDLIPSNLTPEATLEWLSKAEAKGLFGKAEVKEIGEPSNRQQQEPKVEKGKMSALDLIISGLGKK
ncbi:hypothetical protein ABEX38_29920 [Priestia megaterium]